MTDSTLDKIVDKVNEGKTYQEIAEDLNYANKNVISNKLRKAGYERNNTFSKTKSGDYFVASISRKEIEEAGGRISDGQHYKKVIEDGRIILELVDDKITRNGEDGEVQANKEDVSEVEE